MPYFRHLPGSVAAECSSWIKLVDFNRVYISFEKVFSNRRNDGSNSVPRESCGQLFDLRVRSPVVSEIGAYLEAALCCIESLVS